jgi:ElaB/YqjD/DUF883 family membrane-anchored ribosome-binding protein
MPVDHEANLIEALEKARTILQDAINDLLDDDWDRLTEAVDAVVDHIDDVLDGDEATITEEEFNQLKQAVTKSLSAKRLAVPKAEAN